LNEPVDITLLSKGSLFIRFIKAQYPIRTTFNYCTNYRSSNRGGQNGGKWASRHLNIRLIMAWYNNLFKTASKGPEVVEGYQSFSTPFMPVGKGNLTLPVVDPRY
jgi:hypothetical protein